MHPYFFDIRGYSDHHDDHGGTMMPNDAAALDYARRMIRHLQDSGGYNDTALTLIVRDGGGKTVFSLPFTRH